MNHSRILLGISGKVGAGKDEFSDIAVAEYGFIKIPFALALKNEVKEFLQKYEVSFEDRNIWGTQKDKLEEFSFGDKIGDVIEEHPWLAGKCSGITFRLLLQLWGTEYRRAENDNYWVEQTLNASRGHHRVIMSDLRFQNEYDAIRNFGGATIRINRVMEIDPSVEAHSSETGLDHIRRWNYVIDNDSTLEDYHTSCRYILNEIVGEE